MPESGSEMRGGQPETVDATGHPPKGQGILGLHPLGADHLHGTQALPACKDPYDQHDGHVRYAHHLIYGSGGLQSLNDSGTYLDAGDSAQHHQQAQFDVHVSQGSVAPGGHDGFPSHVRQIGAYDEVHWHAD